MNPGVLHGYASTGFLNIAAAEAEQFIRDGEDPDDFGDEWRVKVRPSRLQLHQVLHRSQDVRERVADHRGAEIRLRTASP